MDTVTVNATSSSVCCIRTVLIYSEAAESSGNLVHFYEPVWRHFKADAYLLYLNIRVCRSQSPVISPAVPDPVILTAVTQCCTLRSICRVRSGPSQSH
jgi:hypothetical protein